MNDYTEVAIVAAMEREVEPLIRDWTLIIGHDRHVYEKGHVVVVVGGIGERPAAVAADGILNFREPEVILSVGMAGALDPALSVGDIVVPTKVLRQDGNTAFTIDGGEGTLLTTTGVASTEAKRTMASSFGARAVDMEAYAVAEVARSRDVKFAAVKAISDGFDFELPSMDRFIDEDGRFHAGRFAAHAAVRPKMWPVLSQLRRNAAQATKALCEVLSQIRSAADVDALLKMRASAN